jgi:uncharacterized membrane protein
MNLNHIKVEYVISFSDALFAFSITFMALSFQLPIFSSNISELARRLSITNNEYNSLHSSLSFMVVGMYWVSSVYALIASPYSYITETSEQACEI